jgi:hypothetical protein
MLQWQNKQSLFANEPSTATRYYKGDDLPKQNKFNFWGSLVHLYEVQKIYNCKLLQGQNQQPHFANQPSASMAALKICS